MAESNGARVVAFFEEFLTLGGSFAGQPFVPLPWMKDFLVELFELQPDGRRRYRTYLLGVPRKNAKSTIAAGVALYMLVADASDSNPVIISAAGDRKQAKLVFDEAKRMIRANPVLDSICKIYRDEIKCERTGGIYKVVSADAGLAHGLNPSCVIVDEYHVHKNDELYTALNTGSAMRNEPLTFVITTAGIDSVDSPLGQLYSYGRRVESGEADDPNFGFRWYGPDEGEIYDPMDEATWERFNPSWEILNIDEFRASAKSTPESQFVRYRLNGWVSSETAWLPYGAWSGLADSSASVALGFGDEVVLGFDGAWKGDSTALVACRVEDSRIELLRLWEPPKGDKHWRTPAEEVKQAIRDACAEFNVVEVVADPFRFEQSLLELTEEGLPILEYPTNSRNRIIPATKAFYDAVMDETISHDGNPSLTRHLNNVTFKETPSGGYITKDNRASTKFIDAAIAAVIAHHRAKLYREDAAPPESQMIVL